MQNHFALLYVVVFGANFVSNGCRDSCQLLVVTDDLYLVAGENDGVATWNVQAVRATENAADMRTKAMAKLRCFIPRDSIISVSIPIAMTIISALVKRVR